MSDQLRFDGMAIDQFGGVFSGGFDLEESFLFDQEVTFIVTGKVTGVAMTTNKNGDLRRVNKFQVVEVALAGVQPTTRRGRFAENQIKGQLTLLNEDQGDEDANWEAAEATFPSAPPEEDLNLDDVFRPGVGNVERVGSINPHKDDRLSKFLDEEF